MKAFSVMVPNKQHKSSRPGLNTVCRFALLLSCMNGFSTFGQSPAFVSELRSKLDRYYNENTPQFIDAHFNQPAYVPGDTAWFSLWLTSEREGMPVAGRQIIHVDLKTRSGDIVYQNRVLANNGRAFGQFVVPQSLPSGIYVVVFSTGWNVGGSGGIGGYHEFFVTGDHMFSARSTLLQAHIEGHALVENVVNNFLVSGTPGASVSLLEEKKVLGQLTLDNLGYGQFTFSPLPAKSYAITDGKQTSSLPRASAGLAMTLSFYDSATSLILDLRSSLPREACNLILVSRGKVIYTAMIGLQHKSASVTVPRRNLPEGVILATVFDESNQPVAERMFIANLPAGAMEIISSQTTVRPRQRVAVTVNAPDILDISVRVFDEDLFPTWKQQYDAFTSIGRLPIEVLNFAIDPSWSLSQWNTFLITQQWDRFSWSDVWKDDHSQSRPEKYLRFKGRVVSEGHINFDSVRITFFLRNDMRVYEEYVDPSGAFDVELYFDFYNVEEVIYEVDRKGRVLPGATLSFEPDSSPKVNLSAVTRLSVADPYFSFANLRTDISKSYANYDKINSIDETTDPNASVEDELFSPDVTVILDDYILFPTMEETLREIVPKLLHRWREKHHTVTVALSEPDELATADPVYFIDGIMTDNTDYFMGLKPEEVASIKIISSRRKLLPMGILGRNGVVLVTTKIPDNYLRVPHARKSFGVTGLAPAVVFNKSSNVSSRTPLLHSTALFDSNIQRDAQGKVTFQFLVPDNTGLFCIEVRGMNRSGSPCKSVSYLRSLPPTTTP